MGYLSQKVLIVLPPHLIWLNRVFNTQPWDKRTALEGCWRLLRVFTDGYCCNTPALLQHLIKHIELWIKQCKEIRKKGNVVFVEDKFVSRVPSCTSPPWTKQYEFLEGVTVGMNKLRVVMVCFSFQCCTLKYKKPLRGMNCFWCVDIGLRFHAEHSKTLKSYVCVQNAWMHMAALEPETVDLRLFTQSYHSKSDHPTKWQPLFHFFLLHHHHSQHTLFIREFWSCSVPKKERECQKSDHISAGKHRMVFQGTNSDIFNKALNSLLEVSIRWGSEI